jgi:hypothetical protein
MKPIICKLGGIGCFLLLVLLLYTSRPETVQGWALMIGLVMFLGSLGVIGVLGTGLGTLPYSITGYILIGLTGLFLVLSFYSLWVEEIKLNEAWVLLLYIIIMYAAGTFLISKASELRMSHYLLRFWQADAVLTIEEVEEILREHLDKETTHEQIAKKAEDVLRLLMEQGHVKRVTPTSWKRLQK